MHMIKLDEIRVGISSSFSFLETVILDFFGATCARLTYLLSEIG